MHMPCKVIVDHAICMKGSQSRCIFRIYRPQPPSMSGCVVDSTGSQSLCFLLFCQCQIPRMGGRCSNDGLAEPMNRIRPASASEFLSRSRYSHGGVSWSMSASEFLSGSRYSLDGLVEPMNRVRPVSASEPLSGRVIRSAG